MPAEIKAFAAEARTCFSWSEIQMLEELLVDLKSGKEVAKGMVVVWAEPTSDGGANVRTWRAQLGWADEYVFLDVAKILALEDIRK